MELLIVSLNATRLTVQKVTRCLKNRTILRNTAPLGCKFSVVWFRSSATAATRGALQIQRCEVRCEVNDLTQKKHAHLKKCVMLQYEKIRAYFVFLQFLFL